MHGPRPWWCEVVSTELVQVSLADFPLKDLLLNTLQQLKDAWIRLGCRSGDAMVVSGRHSLIRLFHRMGQGQPRRRV